MKARVVRVYSVELVEYVWPVARLRVECGRGTYIRAIARDLGEALAVGGYLTKLRRTFIGGFKIGDATTIDRISTDGVAAHLRPVD
jgi:tRNA pseudouridine55 synthase